MTDILLQLPRPSWREIEFPITAREFGFQQSQASHRFIFRDDQLIESLGRENPTYRYTIPFREDITGGGWENLFVNVYPDFLEACLDRARGILTDPLHGSTPAKCVSLREILDVNRRDGVDVEVEFIFAPTEDDFSSKNDRDAVIRTLEGAKAFAMRFDAEVAAIPWEQKQPPEPTVNPLDVPSMFNDQVAVQGSRVTAAFGDAARRVENSAKAISELRNPSLAPQLQQARRLREALMAQELRVEPTARPLRMLTVSISRTASALASQLGTPLEDLIRLNPALSRPENMPFVRVATRIWVYADVLSDASQRATR